jgi:hypothetical protein
VEEPVVAAVRRRERHGCRRRRRRRVKVGDFSANLFAGLLLFSVPFVSLIFRRLVFGEDWVGGVRP